MYRNRSYFITPKLRIRIYRHPITGYTLLGILLLIFIVFCLTWLYCDIWISHWLNAYWGGFDSLGTKPDDFHYLWLQPLWKSLFITVSLTIVLMILIDVSIEILKAIDWIISIIKRMSFKRKKYYYIVGLCLILLL